MKVELEITIDGLDDAVRVAGMTLAAMALFQELRKPPGLRTWQGDIAGVVPYNFQPPTLERLRDSYWNTDNPELFVPMAFGIGWGLNLPALGRNLGRLASDAAAELRSKLHV